MSSDSGVFGELPGEVAATVVADPAHRTQIHVDVAVLAPHEPGQQRRVLSLGEANWAKVMTSQHVDRLRRARDLLAVRGYDMTATTLACYSGAGFDADLISAARSRSDIRLIGVDDLYGSTDSPQAIGPL